MPAKFCLCPGAETGRGTVLAVFLQIFQFRLQLLIGPEDVAVKPQLPGRRHVLLRVVDKETGLRLKSVPLEEDAVDPGIRFGQTRRKGDDASVHIGQERQRFGALVVGLFRVVGQVVDAKAVFLNLGRGNSVFQSRDERPFSLHKVMKYGIMLA